jgi:multiple sugar transport system permease protein
LTDASLTNRSSDSLRQSALSAWCERHFKWLIAAPAVLLILALSIYPLLFSLWVNFVNYDFEIPGHDFVGLNNFTTVAADTIAQMALLRTVLFSVANVAIEFLLGLALALAMVKSFRGRGFVMSVLIIPLFISPVIVGQSWALFLQRPFGPANYILSQILGRPVEFSWLSDSPWYYMAIVIADVWQWTPFMFVILLAGLAAIPQHLYEAAELDGLSTTKAFFYITVPQLKSIITLAITLRLLDAVRLFDVIFMMTGGGPGTSTYTASYYLYQVGFQQFHLGVANAGSWIFLILLSIVIMILVRRLLKAEKV